MRRLWAGLVTTSVALTGGSALALQSFAELNPVAAAELIPWSNGAQRSAAAVSLKAGATERAEGFATTAISAMPFDQFALAVSSSGKPPQQQLAILNLAAALGWRDPATNVALVRAAIREKRTDVAAQRVDALGRTMGANAVLPFIDRVVAMQGGKAALAARAETRNGQSWWEGYFRSKPATRAIARQRAELLMAFDRQDGAWFKAMLQSSAIGFAHGNFDDLTSEVWRGSLAANAEFSGPLFDPYFRNIDLAGPTIGSEWNVARTAPALVSINPVGGLTIERFQTNSGTILSQNFPTSPGSWRITIDSAERGNPEMAWQLACAGKGRLVFQRIKAGAVGQSTYQFSVPQACAMLSLKLQALPRTKTGSAQLDLRSVTMARI